MTKKNFDAQDLLEAHHPRYYSSSDVSLCCTLDKAVDGDGLIEEDKALVASLVDSLKRKNKAFASATKAACAAYLAVSKRLDLFDAVADNLLAKPEPAKPTATSRNFTIAVHDSNGDISVMVVALTHKQEEKFRGLTEIFDKARKAYNKCDGSETLEDCIEAALKKAGFQVAWPLGNYTSLEA